MRTGRCWSCDDLAREHEAELLVVAVALPRLMENVDDKSLAELSFYSRHNRRRALRSGAPRRKPHRARRARTIEVRAAIPFFTC
jgi:hypothetical protein